MNRQTNRHSQLLKQVASNASTLTFPACATFHHIKHPGKFFRLAKHFSVSAILCASLFITAIPTIAQTNAEHQQFLFAYRLMQRGEADLATEAFEQYLDQFPEGDKRGDAMYYQAVLLQHAGRSDQAAALLSKVTSTKLVPASALNLMRGQVNLDEKRYDAALEHLEKINEAKLSKNGVAVAKFLKGRAYRGAGNLEAAAKHLREAGVHPGKVQPQALLELSRVLLKLDKTQDAINSVKQCLALNNNATEAEAARLGGDLSYQLGDYAQAIQFYERVIRAHQTNEHFQPSVLGMMWSHHAAGRYEIVFKKLEENAEVLQEEQLGEAFYIAGASAAAADHHELAVQLLEDALKRATSGTLREKMLYRLAVSQFEMGWIFEMKQTVKKLETEIPQSELLADAQFLIAVAEAEQGDASIGAAKLTEMINKGVDHPYYKQAVLRRARLYEKNGKFEAAAKDYQRYVEIGNLDNPAVVGAALKYLDLNLKLGEYKEVEAVTKLMLETTGLEAGAEQEARFRLMLSLIRQNRHEEALRELDTLDEKFPLHGHRTVATYYRGLLLMSLEQDQLATEALNKAAGFETLPLELRVNALRLLGIQHRQNKAFDDALAVIRNLEGLVGASELKEDELLWLSNYFAEQHLDDQAVRYLLVLTALPPSEPQGDNTETGTAKPAITYSDSARAQGLYMLGQIYRREGELEQARTALAEVFALGKGFDLESRIEMALLSADEGRFEQALAELSDLRSSEASEIAARALLESARIHRRIAQRRLLEADQTGATESREASMKLLKRLVLLYPYRELEPLPQKGYLELASVLRVMGQDNDSREAVMEMIEHYPEGDYTLYAKALLAEQMKKLGDARALTNKLDQISDPYLVGKLKLLVGRLELAE
ncbi:tetratricopeptide repeat protein [Poriferisphaera sp. WC338]|uniref:tetratricopeptide repeat protein n=1 Tax=Poriferisphaera sp. WC338 TaxID=3425129 RepID=UPI003D813297